MLRKRMRASLSRQHERFTQPLKPRAVLTAVKDACGVADAMSCAHP